MKGLTPKADNTQGDDGKLTAAEFNDMRNDAQNVVTESGQVLTAAVGDDNRQLMKAVAVGGKRISRATGETADVGDIVLPDNSAGSVVITLPDIAELFINATVDFEQVIDQAFTTHSLIVARNSQLIMGLSEDFVVDSANADFTKFRFIWKAGTTGWSVIIVAHIAES